MNLKQAHYIRTIAQCGSITMAAKKLYVSQPSLSQMLRQIEDEIGLAIFDRSVSPFRITYAGEKYIAAAEAMLAINDQLESQLREIKDDHSGRLRLGISVQRSMQILPLVIPIFHQKYPNVVLELTECGSASLEELLQNGKIDLAFASIESAGTNMVYELIEQETIGILAGCDSKIVSRIAPGTPVTLDDLTDNLFIYLREGHSIRVIQDKLFRRSGFNPQVLLETNTLEVGKRVALTSGACMLISNIYIDDYTQRLKGVFYPLKNYDNHRHLYACYRKDEFLPEYARVFIQITSRLLDKQKKLTGIV